MRFRLGRRGVAVAAGAVVATVVASTAIAGSTAGPTYNLKKLKGSITADGSSTVGPYTTAAAELFRRAGATGVKVTVGISGTGGGFSRFCKGETDLSGRIAADAPQRGEAVQGRQHRRLARVHGGQRRAHRRGQPAEHVGALPHGRRAEEDLGARLQGQQLEGRPRRASRTCRSSSSAPAPTRERSTTSPRRSTAGLARAAPTSRRPRTTTQLVTGCLG